MNVSTLVRSGTLVLGLVALAACGDAPSAPAAPGPDVVRSIRPDSTSVATLQRYGSWVPVTQIAWNKIAFSIDPTRPQNVAFGDNTISFPAYSICNPYYSGYGEDLWDAPCQPLRRSITFTVEWNIRESHAIVEFEPSVRFVPAASGDVDRWVVLSLFDRSASQLNSNFSILWRDATGSWVDEATSDSSMVTFVDRGGLRVSRRIKHFSGYNVTAGFTDSEAGVDDGLSGVASVGVGSW